MTGRLERVVALEPGQLDDLLDQLGEPVALGQHPPGEALHGLGVVGGVGDRLGEQADRADRGLQLVADVGHEVAADRLDAALARAVLDERQHQAGAQRRHARGQRAGDPAARARAARVALADLAVPADLRDEVDQLGHDGRLPRTSPKAYAGAEALRTWSDSSTTTALERRMLSTAATPGLHDGRLLDLGQACAAGGR